jgi:hypothetical protein
MAISFPFEFVDLGVPVPFVILPNPGFPGETKPLYILENQGVPPGPDKFITTGALPFPNDPDPWSLTFHWATAGAPTAGEWQLDISRGCQCWGREYYRAGGDPGALSPSLSPGDPHFITTLPLEFRRRDWARFHRAHLWLRQEPEHPRRRASLAISPQGHSFSTLSRACARPVRE